MIVLKWKIIYKNTEKKKENCLKSYLEHHSNFHLVPPLPQRLFDDEGEVEPDGNWNDARGTISSNFLSSFLYFYRWLFILIQSSTAAVTIIQSLGLFWSFSDTIEWPLAFISFSLKFFLVYPILLCCILYYSTLLHLHLLG